MKRLSLLLALVVCGMTFAAHAEDENKPAAEIQKLSKTLGKWKVDETNYESPFGPAGKSNYEAETRAIHNGHYIQEQGKGTSMGKKVTYTGLTYWDAKAKVYRGMYFDSNGLVFPADATLDGDTMNLSGSFDADGKKIKMKGKTTFAADYNSFKYEWNFSEDDGKTWKPIFSGTGTRTGK